MKKNTTISRRNFIGTTLVGAAGIALFPGCVSKGNGPMKLGFIGLGRQAMYLLSSFINIEGVRIVAGADVYGIKNKRFEQRVKKHYDELGISVDVNMYADYKDLLAREDIDAVVIASPDHWHAHMAIDASNAGKAIYLEKPLTFSIEEGKRLVETVRSNGTILGVGSQQRSDPNFQHAVKMVQEGRLGSLEKISVYVGDDPHPTPFDKPEQPLPETLDWKAWLGPNPHVHFNEVLNPPISLDPPQDEKIWGAWRWYKELGGGLMTDWGAHMFDIAQWGIGKDLGGPVKVIPAGVDGREALTYLYDNGLEMVLEPFNEGTRGVKFWGTDGWIEISRGAYNASDDALKPVVEDTDVPYEARAGHHVNFIEAAKQGVDPVVPVEIGHRTNSVCVLGNIAFELGRSLEWDPATEAFVNDDEANSMLGRSYADGFSI